MPGSLHKGLCFEALAENFLRQQGSSVLQRGYRCRFGEIDLILRDDGIICFVEVKYRKSTEFGGAAYAITALTLGGGAWAAHVDTSLAELGEDRILIHERLASIEAKVDILLERTQ